MILMTRKTMIFFYFKPTDVPVGIIPNIIPEEVYKKRHDYIIKKPNDSLIGHQLSDLMKHEEVESIHFKYYKQENFLEFIFSVTSYETSSTQTCVKMNKETN